MTARQAAIDAGADPALIAIDHSEMMEWRRMLRRFLVYRKTGSWCNPWTACQKLFLIRLCLGVLPRYMR